jgi:hypothetical protein
MTKFIQWLEEKKKGTKESLPSTVSSAPTRGANQDQSGFNGKNDVADYTISDETKSKKKKELDEYEGPDNWEENPPAIRSATATELANLAGAVHLPHHKIKESAMVTGEPMSGKVQAKVSMGGSMPKSHSALQAAASQRVVARDKADRAIDKEQQKQHEQQVKQRETEAKNRKTEVQKQQPKPMAEEVLSEGRPRKHAGSLDDPGSDNIINQLRQVITLRGQKPVRFVNGSSIKLVSGTAHRLLAMYDNLRTTAEKHAFSRRIHASPESLRDVLAGKKEFAKPKITLAGKITGNKNADKH